MINHFSPRVQTRPCCACQNSGKCRTKRALGLNSPPECWCELHFLQDMKASLTAPLKLSLVNCPLKKVVRFMSWLLFVQGRLMWTSSGMRTPQMLPSSCLYGSPSSWSSTVEPRVSSSVSLKPSTTPRTTTTSTWTRWDHWFHESVTSNQLFVR